MRQLTNPKNNFQINYLYYKSPAPKSNIYIYIYLKTNSKIKDFFLKGREFENCQNIL